MKFRSPNALWLLVSLVAYAGIAAVGVQTARQANEMRDLFQQLSESRRVQDERIREQRLLLLERATQAGLHNVERIAAEQLDMRFPDAVVRVDARVAARVDARVGARVGVRVGARADR